MADINGNNKDNILNGTSDPDNIFGFGGNDIVEGFGGADEMHGGNGLDTLSYANSSVAVNVQIFNDGSFSASGGDAEGDTGDGFENLLGSFFNDTLIGNDFANVLRGGGGDDNLVGRIGKDKLIGGAGGDDLRGGIGADILKGGAGFDYLNYSDSDAGVTVRFGKNGAETIGKGGEAQGDRISKVENIRGSIHDDVLNGNNLANVLSCNPGNDRAKGGGGSDTIGGNTGDDIINGGSGNDSLTGGADNDTFVFGLHFGKDLVIDFVAGAGTEDVIKFDKDLFKTFDQVIAASSQDGANVVIVKGSNTITLVNVNLVDLHQDDFSFF
jgi:Ca2+-binding RTX toxin-like protein